MKLPIYRVHYLDGSSQPLRLRVPVPLAALQARLIGRAVAEGKIVKITKEPK